MIDEIRVCYKVTRKDLKEFVKGFISKVLHYNMYAIIFLVISLISLLIFLIFGSNLCWFIVSLISFIFFAYIIIKMYIIPSLRFNEDKIKSGNFYFSDSGFKIETDNSCSELKWDFLRSIFITNEMYIFWAKKSNRPWFLPNTVFKNISEFEKLIYELRDKGYFRIRIVSK